MSHLPRPAPARPTAPMQTNWGAPMPDPAHSLTVGPRGPIVLDQQFFDLHQSFNRERIPERVVHAQGIGAHGYFQVTDPSIASLCKADIFSSVGKKTDAFVRFSSVAQERGGADTIRDPRGFSMKFYTNEGNWDLVANNVPVFFIRDGMDFPSLIHSQKRDPKTNLKDANAFWDFLSHRPESVHMVTMLFGDRGIPASWRHTNAYGNHTFVLVSKEGKRTFVKFHVRAQDGVKTLTSDAAEAIRGGDPDFLSRDLVDFLMAGGEAKWNFFIQAIPEEDAAKLPYDIMDVTKVVPHGDYPLMKIGELVLNRMVDNFFGETEQVAFCPANLVPGIEASTDRLLQARLFAYADTQRHRLGPNFHLLPINRAVCPVHNINRDGLMNVSNPGAEKPYFTGDPASATTGGAQGFAPKAAESGYKVEGVVGRYSQTPADPDADFVQPRALFKRVMTAGERERLCCNIAHLLGMARPDIQERMIAIFNKVDPEYGAGVKERIGAFMAMGGRGLTSSKDPSGFKPDLVDVRIKTGNSVVDASRLYLTCPHRDILARSGVSETAEAAAGAGKPAAPGLQPGQPVEPFATGSSAVGTMSASIGAVKGALKAAVQGVKSIVTDTAGSGTGQLA